MSDAKTDAMYEAHSERFAFCAKCALDWGMSDEALAICRVWERIVPIRNRTELRPIWAIATAMQKRNRRGETESKAAEAGTEKMEGEGE